MADYAALIAKLEDEREEAKDLSRIGTPWDPATAQRIANTMYDAASAIEALAIANAADNDTLYRTLDDNAALRERIEALERERDEARALLIAFCGPHAATYAREFGFAPGELHPVHYDILERAGARMDDFRRADICLSRADAEANSNGEPSS